MVGAVAGTGACTRISTQKKYRGATPVWLRTAKPGTPGTATASAVAAVRRFTQTGIVRDAAIPTHKKKGHEAPLFFFALKVTSHGIRGRR